MPSLVHDGFKIKSLSDGTLYRECVGRREGSEFQVGGKATRVWETHQYMGAKPAIDQAVYSIYCSKIRI